MEIKNVQWLGHAGFLIRAGSRNLIIDPFRIPAGTEKADLLLITHPHFDHFDRDDIKKVIKDDTLVISPPGIFKSGEHRNLKTVAPGFRERVGDVILEAVPAYNVRPERLSFHPRSNKWVGYIIEFEGRRIYHAGDTDFIEEMRTLRNIHLALLPAGGTYTMAADEAIEAANFLGAEHSAPIHYKNLVGEGGSAELEKTFLKSVKGGIILKEAKPTYSFQ